VIDPLPETLTNFSPLLDFRLVTGAGHALDSVGISSYA